MSQHTSVRGRRIDPVVRKAIIDDLRAGWPMKTTSERNGVSYETVRKIKGGLNAADAELAREAMEGKIPQPRKTLSPEAKKAQSDIAYFAGRYFGAILQPWQLFATDIAMELYHSEHEEYIVVNAPPGSGKSFFFTRILPAWITCKDRSIRGLIGSGTASLAKNYTLQLRREFERLVPIKARTKDLQMGLALDAETTMAMDFGSFKPFNPDLWRAEQFTVAQIGDVAVTEKEPSWSSFGPDSGFLGGRYPFIIWDDLWDPRKLRSMDAKDEIKKFWSDIAEARLEPGGLMILQGQRFGPDDIYRYALDQFTVDDDGERVGNRYHHIKFKAHYDDRCTKDHGRDSPPYPKGCLLSPRRLPYRRLAGIMANRSETFEVVYQQEDIDPANVLVNPLWISGGRDGDGTEYPGCWDNDRGLCELPKGLSSPLLSIATADPSPANYWAVEWWVVHPASEQRFLMDLERKAMGAPEFLDWNYNNDEFIGLAQQWQVRSVELGLPITHWIVESNAAQRFLLQFEHTKRWQAKWGLTVIGHETHRNKADPLYGIQTIGNHYRWGRVRLPGKGDARMASLKLVDEVTKYPQGVTTDCVMAHWFLEWGLSTLVNTANHKPTRLWRPSWFKKVA